MIRAILIVLGSVPVAWLAAEIGYALAGAL